MLIKKGELEDFKQLMKGLNPQEAPFSLGKIDPSYSGGRPRVVFDGEGTASSKGYPYLSSYYPSPGDRVILVNIAGSHVILGKIV